LRRITLRRITLRRITLRRIERRLIGAARTGRILLVWILSLGWVNHLIYNFIEANTIQTRVC
jgi:hypothetical protein